MADRTIGFIGAGKLATGLAMALHANDYKVTAVSSRSLVSAQRLANLVAGCEAVASPDQVAASCNLVFIATPDEAIERVARSVRWLAGQAVVHCSGAASLEPLAGAASDGALVASFHPLQTLSSLDTPVEASQRLAGIFYALEGRGWVAELLEDMANKLGGQAIRVTASDRVLYHQAAVLACGYVTTLLKAAEDLWLEMGFSPSQARAALGPLAQTTVANYARVGAEASVTGPVARGDEATVASHLEALRSRVPSLVPLVCTLGLESLTLSSPEAQERLNLKRLFRDYLRDGVDALVAEPAPPEPNHAGR